MHRKITHTARSDVLAALVRHPARPTYPIRSHKTRRPRGFWSAAYSSETFWEVARRAPVSPTFLQPDFGPIMMPRLYSSTNWKSIAADQLCTSGAYSVQSLLRTRAKRFEEAGLASTGQKARTGVHDSYRVDGPRTLSRRFWASLSRGPPLIIRVIGALVGIPSRRGQNNPFCM